MKTAIVPAQVTTVEDKIAGNLNLSQLLLLIVPLFCSSLVYISLPPNLHFALYKIILAVVLIVIFCVLAIRVKDRILFQWVIVILQYNLRPRYHLFDKNDFYLREDVYSSDDKTKTKKHIQANHIHKLELPVLDAAEVVKLQQIVSNPKLNLTFKHSRKGGTNVLITEIK